jgi:hypothetical protein
MPTMLGTQVFTDYRPTRDAVAIDPIVIKLAYAYEQAACGDASPKTTPALP